MGKFSSEQVDNLNSSIQDIYDKRAPKYEDSFHSEYVHRFVALIKDPPLVPGNQVLDLACGTGLLTRLIAEKVAPSGQVVGYDLSPGMLQVARDWLEKMPREQAACITYGEGNMAKLGQVEGLCDKEGSFDLISCASAFVLVHDPELVIREWARYLKPGTGRILVDVPHTRNLMVLATLDEVGEELGLLFPSNRRWITGEDALRNMFKKADPNLEVEFIAFEQYTGEGTIYYDTDEDSAARLFDERFGGVFFDEIRKHHMDKAPEIKRRFIEKWAKEAGPDGRVAEVDGGWVAMVRRTK